MIKDRKRRLLFRFILLAATLTTFFSTSGVPALAADEPLRFNNVVLSVYPEYDDPLGLGYPTVLVMLDGQIEGANLPVNVRFLVPKGAQMYSAGSGPRESYKRGASLELGKPSDIDGWDEISYELESSTFVVEYYLAIPTSPNRDFSVEFIPLFDINGLVALVQEPRQAADFNVVSQNQTVERSFTDAEGFKIQRYPIGPLKSRQLVSFHISYTKDNQAPSLAISSTSPNVILIVIALVIVGGIILVIVLSKMKRNSSSRRRGRDRVSGKPPLGKSAGARFCTKCGARLDKTERFCPKCGAKQLLPPK